MNDNKKIHSDETLTGLHIPGYSILRKINSGGMASVFLATQLSLNRTVALKIMKPELDYDPEFHQRFQREAEIVGQLSHPNIIPIYDIGRHQAMNYISMEYLPAGSLEQKIIEGITAGDAADLIVAIAAALEHAHTKGYVHRDIKPENILFRSDGSPVLTDFGIARTIKTKSNLTQVGIVIGTPYYMSPEQAKGLPTDGRADLYSLGILFYEMLTGTRPFQSDNALALAIQHINEKAPKLPVAFFHYQPIINRLLAKKPEHRFQHAREFIVALEAAKNSVNPMLTQIHSKAHRMHLFKAVAYTIAHDGKILLGILNKYITQLVHKISGKQHQETVLVDTSLAPDIHNAKTGLYQPATQAPAPAVPKRTGMYVGSAILLLIIASILFFNSKPKNQREQWGAFFNSKNKTVSTKEVAATKRLSLNIETTPQTASVRILNITEKYTPGIVLPAGEYHLEIKAPGYQTKTEWISLRDDDQPHLFTLNKSANTNDIASHIIPAMEPIAIDNPTTTDAENTGEQTSNKAVPDNNFYIGKYEITFNEYDDFAITTNRSLPDDNGWGRGERPVINVSWDDAQAYVNWLSKITGNRYRLPSATEWEFAARGNTTSIYWWGNSESDGRDRANCRFDCKSLWSSLFNNKTTQAGSFPANDFGIYDSAGNVSEWIEDCYSPSENSACDQRIIRGGSFRDSAKEITSSSAIYLPANSFNTHIGFRVLKEVDSERKFEKESTKTSGGNAFQRFINKLRR